MEPTLEMFWVLISVCPFPKWLLANLSLLGVSDSITHRPLQSAASTVLFHWCMSLWRPLGSPGVTVLLQVWAAPHAVSRGSGWKCILPYAICLLSLSLLSSWALILTSDPSWIVKSYFPPPSVSHFASSSIWMEILEVLFFLLLIIQSSFVNRFYVMR